MLRALLLLFGVITLLLTCWLGFLRQQSVKNPPPAGLVYDSPSTGEIFSVNWFGRGLTFLSEGLNEARYPIVRDDGSLVFTAIRENDERHLFQLKNGEFLQLSQTPIYDLLGTPDGQNFYLSGKDNVGLYHWQGGELTLLSDRRIQYVRWGRQDIAFWGDSLIFSARLSGGNNSEIYQVDTKGGAFVNVTRHPLNDWQPRISADGEWLFFTTDRTGDWEIFKMRMDGSERTNLSKGLEQHASPTLSPDGEFLFYSVTETTKNIEIYRMRLADGSAINLTQNPAYDMISAISEDGGWLIFESNRDGQPAIYRMDIDGKHIQRLALRAQNNSPEVDFLPARPLPWQMGLNFGIGLLCCLAGVKWR